jgi:hypothetical protein
MPNDSHSSIGKAKTHKSKIIKVAIGKVKQVKIEKGLDNTSPETGQLRTEFHKSKLNK